MNKRPKCSNSKCEKDGWICVGGDFYCSDCVIRWQNKQKENLRKEMEEC